MLPDEAHFCFNCGYPTSDVKVLRSCEECGNTLSTMDKFCSRCGVPVKVVKEGAGVAQTEDKSRVTINKNPKMILIPGGQFVMGGGSTNSLVTLVSY